MSLFPPSLRGARTASKRLRALQVVTVLSVFRTARSISPQVYERYGCLARPELGAADSWLPAPIKSWRRLTFLSGLAWLILPGSAIAGITFTASSAGLQRQVVRFHRPLFSYTNHLPATVAVQAAALAVGGETVARSALRSLELFQATIYAQAAAMKFRDGGIQWLTEGNTTRVAIHELGRVSFQHLAARPVLIRWLATGSVAAEAAVLPVTALAGTGIRRALGVGLLAFHGGIKVILGISFWHLWWQLLPQLLWSRNGVVSPVDARRGRALPVVLAAIAAGGNISASVAGRNLGPFCSYAMFSGRVPSVYSQLRVRVYLKGGTASDVEDVRGLLPFEFFRTVSILEALFLGDVSDRVRKSCAQTIVDGLNDAPWGASDEVYPSIRRPGDAKVTGFDMLVMTTNSSKHWLQQIDDTENLKVVYTFRVAASDSSPA